MEAIINLAWPVVCLVIGSYGLVLVSRSLQESSRKSDHDDLEELRQDIKDLQDKVGSLLLAKSQRQS